MPASMTGFGVAEGVIDRRLLQVEIKSVNHRFFNFSGKYPADLVGLEQLLREEIRHLLARGHINCTIRWVDASETADEWDWNRLSKAADALRQVQQRLNLAGDLNLDTLFRFLDRQRDEPGTDVIPPSWNEVAPIVRAAAAACRESREREGAHLNQAILASLSLIESSAERVRERAPFRIELELARLRKRVGELLAGQPVPEDRLSQEIVILADRLDISEELIRLEAHCKALRSTLGSDEPLGKRLGFLVQEIGREINTIGSKANDAPIAHEVVGMKGELEKIREQVENLE